MDNKNMIRLRPYKRCDAAKIAEWVSDKEVYMKWGGNIIGDHPLSAETIDRKYRDENGGCEEADNFYPWTAVDEEGNVVGSFIMRYMHGDSREIRFGWVVVDSSIRGRGTGKQMLTAGLKYAFDILGANVVTIGVFEGNDIARNCYKKVGFTEKEVVKKEPWNVIEMEITKEN